MNRETSGGHPPHADGPDCLTPLFWQHGEPEAVLRREIAQMRAAHIRSFIAESRPHPDYLGDGWWRDLGILIDEARKQGMRVWFFDDGSYPSGGAGGRLAAQYPRCVKRYLAENHMDAAGPLRGSSFLIGEWLEKDEELVRVVGGRRNRSGRLEERTLIDLTPRVQGGVLYWDVPPGAWRVFVLKKTRRGGEEWTREYLNPLDPEGPDAFIRLIYEAHYRHFGADFGGTVAGFFTDEPRFGNEPTYDGRLGRPGAVLPYSDTLLGELSARAGQDISPLLPCLWYQAGGRTPDMRYLYMDTVSRRFSQQFLGRIGAWCRARGVRLIGHVVEENGAHARLGFGPGHYFRAMEPLDAAGIDVVCNVVPGHTDGRFATAFNEFDADFNHWGLAKMASSASHIDPRKGGLALCEAFGAYGWSEGLRRMKWITDSLCVRGINWLVPHAFSPREYPDPDCPPHFYAGGHNPQFRRFAVWSAYAARVCGLLTGGRHAAPAAVLYHAEAEWGGRSEPFEKAVKALMRRQIDCDVLPADLLADRARTAVRGGRLAAGGEDYGALVVPYAEYLPAELAARLGEFAAAGVPVIFTGNFPRRCYGGGNFNPDGMRRVPLAGLPALAGELGLGEIRTDRPFPLLACYRYRAGGEERYFLVNQSVTRTFDGTIVLPGAGPACLYDAMEDRAYAADPEPVPGGARVALRLGPYESLFVIFGRAGGARRRAPSDYGPARPVAGPWRVEAAAAEEYPAFHATDIHGPGNVSVPGGLPEFSGTLRYTVCFDSPAAGECLVDLGEVYEVADVRLNGRPLGTRICPPYRFEAGSGVLRRGENRLEIEVINTLVKSNPHNIFDRYWPQEPSGLLGPVRIRAGRHG